MAELVYILCALASFGCAVLLLRGYSLTRTRLLLWGGLCFVALMLNNVLVFVDLVLVPSVDLFAVRNLVALAGVAVFAVGLIWDTP